MFDVGMTWQWIVIAGAVLIAGTVFFGCYIEKVFNELLNESDAVSSKDEHEEFPGS